MRRVAYALAARGKAPASHRGRRGAPLARRDEREYREYLNEEQRSQRGCIAGRMQLAFYHGLLAIGLFALAGAPAAEAQTAAPHKHYDKPAAFDQAAPGMPVAPRLQNLGVHTFRVTTRNQKAQVFINQGVNLAYGFNHAEAGRAFAEAARLDPNCAMAYWGQALVLGPNINAAMTPEDEPKAFELARKAVALKAKASARERMYIDAIAPLLLQYEIRGGGIEHF